METPLSTPRRGALHTGGAAILLGNGAALPSRLEAKIQKASAQPPHLPGPDGFPPAGKSTNCHAPGWHRAVERTEGGALLAEQPESARQLSERPLYGGPPVPFTVGRKKETELPSEVSDEVFRFQRKFISRARGPGPHRVAGLLQRLRLAGSGASGEEVLSPDTFRDVSLREGPCRGFHECQLLFGHFAQGRSAVPVNDLAALVLGNLDAKRQQVVLEVWSKLDPEGLGKVPVWQLLRHFDVRRLPDVRFGREDVEGARQKLLEGLGVVQCRAADRAAEFDLEEAAARRRPAPIGLPGGGPVVAPAGRAGIRARDFEDAKRELQSRGEAIDPEAVVSFEAWQAYFMAVSVGVLDDDVFALTLRDPLRTFEVHGKAHAQRLVMEVPEKHRPCNLRLLGTFADGSRQALTLRDDSGLEHLSGNAGCGDGQFWTWGPKVRDEIIRRFKAEGYEGLQTVSLRPF